MFEAQYLFREDAVLGPWMPRRGDNVIVTIDVAGIHDRGAQINVSMYHKNEEDPGDGTALTGILSVTDIGRARLEYTGLKELVRYGFDMAKKSPVGSRTLFRMLTPVWFDDLV